MSPTTTSPTDRQTAGIILAAGTKRGIAGLQVFVHSDVAGADDRIAAGVTDSTGAFEVRHRDVARSLEIAAPNSTNGVIVSIARKRKKALRIELSAGDLATLIPHRDIELSEDTDRWERQRLIGREAARSRAQRTMDRSARQRAFGEHIARQVNLGSVPTATRDDDKAYVAPDMAPEDRAKKVLEVAEKGLKDAPIKQRTIKVSGEKLADLEARIGNAGRADFDDVVTFGAAPIDSAPTPEAEEILERLRAKAEATRGSESAVGETTETGTDDTDEDGNGGGTTTQTEQGVVSASPSQYVRDAITQLNANGHMKAADAPTAAGRTSVMEGGPADTTSHHEFRDVRIAFDPVWTELYDRELSQMITKVLGGLEWLSDDLPFEEISALADLLPVLELADEAGADFDEPADLVAPSQHLATLLQISPAEFSGLSDSTRSALEALATQHRVVDDAVSSAERAEWGAGQHGPYHRTNVTGSDPGDIVNTTVDGDFWRVGDLAEVVTVDGFDWIDQAAVHRSTGFTMKVPDWRYAWAYYYEGANDGVEYIKSPGDKRAFKLAGRTYIEVDRALDTTFEQFQADAKALYDAGRPATTVGDESMATQTDDGGVPTVSTNLEALARVLKEVDEYRFKIFDPGSVNFGIMLRYRQAWEPQRYQVGELVNTIPLSPKESRKYKKHIVRKTSRNRKEINKALSSRSDAEETTGRAESEIVQRAKTATNFQATAQGKGGIGVVEFGGSATARASAEEQAGKNKKKFRQAVQKAAHEYRQERSIEITTVSSEDIETTESGEITNPNEEITVTYLFYELQKQFMLSEQLVDIEPVVLVAQDVPTPSELTESWLIRHDWILKRVLLDDSFEATLAMLHESDKARDLVLGVLKRDLERKTSAYQAIKDQLVANASIKDATTAALRHAVSQRVVALNEELSEGDVAGDVALTVFTHGLFGSKGLLGEGGTAGQGGAETAEAAEARQEATEETLSRVSEEARRLRSVLESAGVALDGAIQKYTNAIRARLNKELAVLRLRNHIAQNILHYMQAIWEYEPPDQRYFRLYDRRVPLIGGKVDVDIGADEATLSFSPAGTTLSDLDMRRLSDVADLDRPLGYRGNFIIFPLHDHNYVTGWMAQDYLDETGHVVDPQTKATPNLAQTPGQVQAEVETLNVMLADLTAEAATAQAAPDAASLWEAVGSAYEAANRSLRHRIEIVASQATPIVVPTDLLFVEALTGAHPLLEGFKLGHRERDLRAAAIEEIRRTALMLAGDYEDPDIDKVIHLEGSPTSILTET